MFGANDITPSENGVSPLTPTRTWSPVLVPGTGREQTLAGREVFLGPPPVVCLRPTEPAGTRVGAVPEGEVRAKGAIW